MPRSKQTERRQLAKLRTEFQAAPWSIDVRALGMLNSAMEQGDLDKIQAILALGTNDEFTITKIVNGVAVIPVTGVLRDECDYMVRYGHASSYQQIEKEFNQHLDNSQIKAILFYFDSPGGSAVGCKRVADQIFDNRGIKPIRAYVQGMCGSAAFYMAAACDRIEATADAMVGSVGTIYPHLEVSGFLKEIGYGATVFTNADSPKKGHGNIYEPLSDEAKKTLQDFVNSYGRPFVEDVARYRGIEPDDVIASYGQGDALRASVAAKQRVIDAIVEGFSESLESLESLSGGSTNSAATSRTIRTGGSVMNERIKAQLFALGLIDSLDASDAECKAALAGWFKASGQVKPSGEDAILAALQKPAKIRAEDDPEDEDEEEDEDDEEMDDRTPRRTAAKRKKQSLQDRHDREQSEARLENLHAAAELYNDAAGYEAVTLKMVQEAHEKKLSPRDAAKEWAKILAEKEPPVPGARNARVTGEGAEQYAKDVVDALLYRSASSLNNGPSLQLSNGAERHVRKPLWAIAGECLQFSGRDDIDMYGDREYLAEAAMSTGVPGQRQTFFSENEGRQYVQAAGTPFARPGDFPNILSGLANKFLDTVQLDDDYSYPLVSALLPGGLSDFKPAMMINKGIVEELDEVQDAEAFEQLNLSEEVLSYIFLRRFGNKWGWTPVLVANDDLGAFVEGMIGLEEAWQVTQNRLVVDLYTSNPTLLDGNALFSDRANTGTGANPAANDNDIDSGGDVPSDAQWILCENAYADIGGIDTGRRVRGSLNMIYVPTGTAHHEAVRTFAPYNLIGETKDAATTANVGLFRGKVAIVPESELRVNSTLLWYALRSPTRLNTATVVRAYFNGFGTAGRRERWYDPTNKTTWVSLEGRVATAVKNWRYAIRNKGEN